MTGESRQVFGWCGTGHHFPGCPGRIPAHTHPDPVKPGTQYAVQEQVCPCSCHQRVESESPS